MRNLKFYEAIREATAISLQDDPSVYLIGLGVPDPKGIFGTTEGLQSKFGSDRVMDMPISENGMTGVAISYVLSTVTQTIFFIFAYKKIMAEIDDKKLSSRDK